MIVFGRARHFLSPKMQTWDELAHIAEIKGAERYVDDVWSERDAAHGGRKEAYGTWPLRKPEAIPTSVVELKRAAQ